MGYVECEKCKAKLSVSVRDEIMFKDKYSKLCHCQYKKKSGKVDTIGSSKKLFGGSDNEGEK